MNRFESEVQTEVKALSDEAQALDFDGFDRAALQVSIATRHTAIFDDMKAADWAFWLQWLRIWVRFMREPKLLGPSRGHLYLVAGGKEGLTLYEAQSGFWIVRNDNSKGRQQVGYFGKNGPGVFSNYTIQIQDYEALSKDFALNWRQYRAFYFGGGKPEWPN